MQHYTFTSANAENTVRVQGEAYGLRSLPCTQCAVITSRKQQSCTQWTASLGCATHPACCSLDVLCSPFNSAGQRSPLVSSGMKVIKGDICQVAVHFLQLLKDDATLLLNLRILQRTVLHKVTQKLYNCNTIPTLASHCLTATQCC